MAKAVVAGLGLLAASTALCGCGAGAGSSSTLAPSTNGPSPSGSSSTLAPAPVVSSTTVAPAPVVSSTTLPADRTPLYVALRMDDISLGYLEEDQAAILDWFAANKVKFNFHIITKTYDSHWPSDCTTDPSSQYCDSPIVQAVQRAYDAGDVLGTSDDAFLQLGCHAHNHEEWPAWIHGQQTGAEQQESDLETSMNILNAAYPEASIRSFAAPGNMANAATVQTCKDKGLDIVSTQASLGCNPLPEQHGPPPGYNYNPGPCGNSNGGKPPYHWDCIPPNDTYYTADGVQTANGVFSVPSSSANSNMEVVEIGISVEDTLGVGKCGCNITVESDQKCPMIPAAVEMARKSNGLHWTVLIMHPQTNFTAVSGQTYPQWLDDFVQKAAQLVEYDVHFVTLEDLTRLHAEHGVEQVHNLVM